MYIAVIISILAIVFIAGMTVGVKIATKKLKEKDNG